MSPLLLALLLPAARAAGESVDTELVRPSWSDGGPVGVDSPWIEQAGVLRVGTVLQLERDPLVLQEYGVEAGTVVTHRLSAHLGMAADLGRGASVRVVLPAAQQWGSEVASLASDGPALGDLRAGVRFVPPLAGPLRAGLRADLSVPTGTRESWFSEATPRLHPGLLVGLRTGALETIAELGVEARATVETGQDFTLGTEAVAGLGLRWVSWPDRAAVSVGLVGRGGLAELFAGGAENSAEVLTGLQLWPSSALQVDLGVGTGLTEGYGTTELRALAGLTWIRRPPPPAPEPLRLVEVEELEDEPVEEEPPAPPAEDGWEEGELARIEADRIVIRQPIQFAYATDRILPESMPILEQVAQLLDEDQSIGHLVVEGHASAEGSFTYNYELSIRRARAVWEALLAGGVHYLRLSYRGMGEVVPVAEGQDEGSLARNRRVEFRIVHRLLPEEMPPAGTVTLPWSGDQLQIDAAAPPPAEPPPQPPPADEWGEEDWQ